MRLYRGDPFDKGYWSIQSRWFELSCVPGNHWDRKRQIRIIRTSPSNPFICAVWSPMLLHVYGGSWLRIWRRIRGVQ